MKLYYHPVSPYSQKVLMALYEKEVEFEPIMVHLIDPDEAAEYRKLHPLGKVPLLVDDSGDRGIPESSIIIEYIDRHCPSAVKLIPDDPDLARQVRFSDRMMDLYVTNMMSKIFFDGMRPESKRDPFGVGEARAMLDSMYSLIEIELTNKTWAMGDDFSMADCAAAPALGYCRMVYPFDAYPHVKAYAGRLFERPSFVKVMKEAEPYLAAFASRRS